MNAVEVLLRYVAVFRRFGIPVTFEPGWETRGNGQTANYRGAVGHHTATPASDVRPQALVTGRPDLPGPLCNLAGLWSGGIHVVAAHPANHAGASGGRSMGPLPVTRLFNPLVVGLEIVYPGTSAMSPAQYRTYLVFIYATAEIFGGGVRPETVELTRGHYETSIEGKPDPAWSMSPWRPYDMNIMRREALTLRTGGDDAEMFSPEAQQWMRENLMGTVTVPLLQSMAARVEALAKTIGEAQNGPDVGEELQGPIDINLIKWRLFNLMFLQDEGTQDRAVVDNEYPFVRAFKEMAETVRQLKEDVAAVKRAVDGPGIE